MKKLLIAVALVVSFAAPAMADNFPNVYATPSWPLSLAASR